MMVAKWWLGCSILKHPLAVMLGFNSRFCHTINNCLNSIGCSMVWNLFDYYLDEQLIFHESFFDLSVYEINLFQLRYSSRADSMLSLYQFGALGSSWVSSAAMRRGLHGAISMPLGFPGLLQPCKLGSGHHSRSYIVWAQKRADQWYDWEYHRSWNSFRF